MLEDFILESARSVVKSGYVRLARAGFTMTLSPTMNVVVGYSTVHRERTWQQVKAGVPSRIRERNRTSRWEDEFAPVPDPGAPVTLDRFPASVDPGSIALTARVRRSFVKIEGLPNEGCDERLDDRIRAEFASFPSGTVTKRDDGLFEVTVEGRTWLVSEDAQTLIGVKRAAADASRPL